ncbi:RecQ family ATP-dependent DNA helicase [Roseobacter sp. CCS2]|uniref:RecQ family ATP-dependent DNA helicase n=1 Tax=Roseobacter sp. CCS2 TaxID=391593 RepID=UPI0000F404AE|nr:RecQ family ATP-dependent DNA helicase [Roseobacter sp. CCS2]EBA13445.1 Possible DNA helicase [Roseobacter sp. CCS2]
MIDSDTSSSLPEKHRAFLKRCLSVDLEVNPKTARVFAFAAVPFDQSPSIVSKNEQIEAGLDRLEQAIDGIEHPIGHNFLQHDMAHLVALRPRLAQIMQAPIDTLWLNPLAFPRNPYHHLVKHYHDGRLQAGRLNDPELDAKLVFQVLANQLEAFAQLNRDTPDALLAYHWLTTRGDLSPGFDAVFNHVRGAVRPAQQEVFAAIGRLVRKKVCENRLEQVFVRLDDANIGWPMAYALSWISVAGGDSVMPPWVRAKFKEASLIVGHLRDTSCKDPSCQWCAEQNDPTAALQRWFGFEAFRPEPKDCSGYSLQERIVGETMGSRSVLGILPTGTGKSVCYQIPALSRFDKTGALTVVVSPLVALMADQVHGMERAGISSSVTINGMMSMPERQDALEKVRMGDASILIISPEQLRSTSIRNILKQREIGFWVLDEAHCVSKWGHDFRPDYRYVARFIKEFSGDEPPAPVLCLTATAKPEVVYDITAHFADRVGVDLKLLDGGAARHNLTFDVRSTRKEAKLGDIYDVISEMLPQDGRSGAVVYCSSRKSTERVAAFLAHQGMAAAHFHAGLSPDEKKDTQEKFRIGDLRVIAATNAFGMGIDKPDIRLVIHCDIPGSLENYLQEAGRAGRDRQDANCVLLYAIDDVERQFQLSARSRLARHEIGAILKAIRRIDERTKKTGKVVATAGEIVQEEKDRDFQRDSVTDDTRVKTAVSWLEEATLLSREENRVQVYPSSLTVSTVSEAKRKLNGLQISDKRRKALIAIVQHLIDAPADEGISTDQLCGVSGLWPNELNKAMADLETFGVARNDLAVTLFVHIGVEGHSAGRLTQVAALEKNLIAALREAAPDTAQSEAVPLHLSETCQHLRDKDQTAARPDVIEKLLRGMARDGRGQDGGLGNISIRKASRNALSITLNRTWGSIDQTAEIRQKAAASLLEYLIGLVPAGTRGKDIQVETTVGDLLQTLTGDIELQSSNVRDMTKLLERALLWLHEQSIVTLGKGLTVFRPAMTVHLKPDAGRFTQAHFAPLEDHYAEQTMQTHVMAAYAELGLVAMKDAEQLSGDYFTSDNDTFLDRWMPGRSREIKRQTTSASWKAIVDVLENAVHQKIVTDAREQTNVLVLAGPGSGKTRVLVHRIAYLLRIKREDANGILVLTYNRHAATEVRARLRALVGDDVNGVTVSTCHALAMRLVGTSFAGQKSEDHDFDGVILEAIRQLKGEGLSPSDAEAQRDALIQGYRWILVDEYQDIGPHEYELISAVAGRSLVDPDLKLSLFAVGDDDQNIYAFKGASIQYIRKFDEDYNARPAFLTENYRSTQAIITAANAVIRSGKDRMKAEHDITVNRGRHSEAAGGAMARHDAVAQGRVQLLDCATGDVPHAMAALDELVRISKLDPDFRWDRTAIIAREWKRLGPVRSYAEKLDITVELANEALPSIWRLREMQTLIADMRQDPGLLLSVEDIIAILNKQPGNRWIDMIAEGIAALARELGKGTMPALDVIEWLAEWSRDTRGDQRGLLLLSAHRAKGLEFDHVVILDGGWQGKSDNEDADAPRRLFYVAMTRAQKTLALTTTGQHLFLKPEGNSVIRRPIAADMRTELPAMKHYELPDTASVDLSFAGRLGQNHPAHLAIAAAEVGYEIRLIQRDGRWTLENLQGQTLGRMAKAWQPPKGHVFVAGHVGAVIRWGKADNEKEFVQYLKRDNWETVLPEMTFELESVSGSCPAVVNVSNTARVEPENSVSEEEGVETVAVETLETNDADDLQLDVLKGIVENAVAQTRTWGELSERLSNSNIKLAPKGGGLVVSNSDTDEELCKLSALKLSYISLIRHYGEGFPKHTAKWLVERALSDEYVPKGSKRPKKKRSSGKQSSGDDFDLIED